MPATPCLPMTIRCFVPCAAVLAALGAYGARPACAADTIEPFAAGSVDLEVYVGGDGIGHPVPHEHVWYGEWCFGYGVIEALSLFGGIRLDFDERRSTGAAGVSGGLVATVLDTPHVDFDLLATVDNGCEPGERFAATPGFELNIDGAPDRSSWGLYLRSGVRLGDHRAPARRSDPLLGYAVETTLGASLRHHERHEWLIEFDARLHNHPGRLGAHFDFGGVAFGYNVTVSPQFELVTGLRVDVPHRGDPWAVGLFTGLIATLP